MRAFHRGGMIALRVHQAVVNHGLILVDQRTQDARAHGEQIVSCRPDVGNGLIVVVIELLQAAADVVDHDHGGNACRYQEQDHNRKSRNQSGADLHVFHCSFISPSLKMLSLGTGSRGSVDRIRNTPPPNKALSPSGYYTA